MRAILWLTIVSSCLNAVVKAGVEECPVKLQRLPYIHVYNDSCLLFSRNEYSWTDARANCRQLGGDLVMIKDAAKNNFVLNSLSADHWNVNQMWIGATDEVHEGDWRWVDGTKVSFNRFASGQGNNHNSGFLFASGSNEDCALIRRDDGGQWHDYPCSPPVLGLGYHYTYICEFHKIAAHDTTTTLTTTATTQTPTTTPDVDTPETQMPTTTMNIETPAPTTTGANIETPAPTTTQGNIETPAPTTTQANIETPAPTTQSNIETPAPTNQPNIETPAPTTQANIETPAPTGHTNHPHPTKHTTAPPTDFIPTAIIGKK